MKPNIFTCNWTLFPVMDTVQAARFTAIEGFAPKQCDLIHTANEINRGVSWRGNADVSQLAGKPVRLKFLVRDADLYAFQFVK